MAWLPSLLFLPPLLLSENLALPLSTTALLLVVRASRRGAIGAWAAAGACCAAAVLVREASLAVALAGIACALGSARRRGTKGLAVYGLVVATGLAPWVARNRAATGVTGLTTGASVNLCIGLGEGATGGYRLLPRFAARSGIDPPDAETEAEALACARRGIERRPLSIVTLAPGKLVRLFAFDDWEVDEFLVAALPAWLAGGVSALDDVAYWLLLAAAAWSVAHRRPHRALVGTIAALALMTIATFGAGRFHALLLPLLAVLAAGRGTPGGSGAQVFPAQEGAGATVLSVVGGGEGC